MSINIIHGTSDVAKWHDRSRPDIQTANWLTVPLVLGGVLPEEFAHARVAPIVVGVGFERQRGHAKGKEKDGFLKASIDSDYLVRPPEAHYNPHNTIKNRVRSLLEARVKGGKPEISLYPGYIFPDVSGGALYLDNTLSDGECTVETISPAGEILSRTYGLGTICVGTEAVVVNDYSYVPEVSLPSVVREALAPNKSNTFDLSPKNFARASDFVKSISGPTTH
jgi:hypothetical protein